MSVIRNFLYFFFSVVLGKLCGITTTFFVAKMLIPADYGLWLTLLLIPGYAGILCLGTVEALVKQFPYYTGKGLPEKAQEVANGVLGSIVLVAILLFIATIVCQFFKISPSAKTLVPFIQLILVATIFEMFNTYYYFRFTAHQRFKIVSYMEALRSIMSCIFLLGFTYVWGLYGTIFGYLITVILLFINALIVDRRFFVHATVLINKELLWTLVKIGFPITIVVWIFELLTSVDRIISMAFLGKEATGFFGLGSRIISIIVLIPTSLGRVLYPKINEQIGKNAAIDELHFLVFSPAHFLSVLLSIILGISIIGAPLLYCTLFPKYNPGLLSAQILLLGSFFICLVRSGINYLIAINKQNILLYYSIVSLALNILLNTILVHFQFGINGLSVGTSIAVMVFTTLIWYGVFTYMGYPVSQRIRRLFSLYLPFGIMVLFLIGVMVLKGSFLSMYGFHTIYINIIYVSLFILLVISIPSMNRNIRLLWRKRNAY